MISEIMLHIINDVVNAGNTIIYGNTTFMTDVFTTSEYTI